MRLEEKITQMITKTIEERKYKNYPLYYQINALQTSNGDESGINIYTYQSTIDQFFREEEKELAGIPLESLNFDLTKRLDNLLTEEGYKIEIEENSNNPNYRTEKDDEVSLKISDHCLHLIIYNSGQY